MHSAGSANSERTGTAGSTVLIFRLARMSGYRLGEALAALEMRTHEFAVLHYLHQAGPLSQQELGSALRINPSNLVGMLRYDTRREGDYKVGDRAPDVALLSLDGAPVHLEARLGSRPTVLVFGSFT